MNKTLYSKILILVVRTPCSAHPERQEGAGDGDSCIHAEQLTDSIELAQRAQQDSIINHPKQMQAWGGNREPCQQSDTQTVDSGT